MARRLTTLTHGVRRSDGGGPLARVTREPPSGSVSRVGWPAFRSKTAMTFSSCRRLVFGKYRAVNAIASTARQANPTITHASPHLWFKVGKASMITRLANQSTLAQIAAPRPRTPVGRYSPWIS